MNPIALMIVAGGLMLASSGATLLFVRSLRVASLIPVLGTSVGSVLGLWAVGLVLRSGFSGDVVIPWSVPGGQIAIGIDPLSAFFLAPVFVLGSVCTVYGRGYLGPRVMPGVLFSLCLVAMMLVLVARDALLFLVAWEAMTLLSYLLVTLDHSVPEVRRAGWVYLIASHVAVVFLLGLFVVLSTHAGGSLNFASFATALHLSSGEAAGILILMLLGFGIKAGIMGVHVWLPEAHAAAPSHVSALMSAVLIKFGLYGILRVATLVVPGAWFGVTLMFLGIGGALVGIALALTQRDLKRSLAYSSIENIGIILLGLGLGFWARAKGDPQVAVIAFGGALIHVWNHAAMKGLMFLGAGSLLHGAGTKDIERLGGLAKRMPWTGRAMILGAIAIAGLPPLNGFVGEWLLYRGLIFVGTDAPTPENLLAMLGAVALALVGGLAALCFVRLIGVVLLGEPRDLHAANAHESPPAMIVPLGVLAAVCLLGAIGAPALLSIQASVLAQMVMTDAFRGVTSFVFAPTILNWVLLSVFFLVTIMLSRRLSHPRTVGTWDCGYAVPTPRMQYTGRGFAELLTLRALPRWLRPRLRGEAPNGVFPSAAFFASETPDPLTRSFYEPFLTKTADRFARLRILQQGNLHIYLVYVLFAVFIELAWVALRNRIPW